MFPETYPAKSPSAEFVPKAFQPIGGATKPGNKGTRVCLSIFSDYADVHKEWANEKGTGWSPSYTVQTVLINLVSFLLETSSQADYYKSVMDNNVKVAKAFSCPDCGHTHSKPWPPLTPVLQQQAPAKQQIAVPESLVCYVTKRQFGEKLEKQEDPIWGFGICQSGPSHNVQLTSPCEFMTLDGFTMLANAGKVESVMREEIHFFLPLYINPAHGKLIKGNFEQSIAKICGSNAFQPKMVLQVIPKLMNSTVVTFMNGTTHTSQRALHGYFAFHRLFLWAISEYSVLTNEIEKTVKQFIDSPEFRMKKVTPNVGEWLTLLTASSFTWENACQAYMNENFERNVMWYLRQNASLGNAKGVSEDTRLAETFRLTQVSRDLCAFQVLFLDVARPSKMTIKEVCERYDANYGLPTEAMEAEMKEAVKKLKAVATYQNWFEVIKIPFPGKAKLNEMLIQSVESASKKDGYFDKSGGRGNNNDRGRGRGGRGRGHY